MKVQVINEAGFREAYLGIGLSYGVTSGASIEDIDGMLLDRMIDVADRLAVKDGGHNKFLEFVTVYLDVDAPRYWWQQFDTYRIGTSRLSESTMHTITRREFVQADFEHPVPPTVLEQLNMYVRTGRWDAAKWLLPESFLQRRIVVLNYMTLRRIIKQRANHRLAEWHTFIDAILEQITCPEWLADGG